MSFNLKQKENENTVPKVTYQVPCIQEDVAITEVILGKSSFKQTPYIELKTINPNSDIGRSSRMYLSTTPSEGKTVAAWDISSKNILDLVCATHNISRPEAEAINLVPDDIENVETQYQMLANKVSTLLVGRKFRGKFKGEQQKENGIVFATLDRVESMNIPRASTRLRFDPNSDIKMYPTTSNIPEPSPFQ